MLYALGRGRCVYACGPYDGGDSWVEPEDVDGDPRYRVTCQGCLDAMRVDAEVPW